MVCIQEKDTKIIKILILVSCFFLHNLKSYSAAWLQPKGSGQIITQFGYSYASTINNSDIFKGDTVSLRGLKQVVYLEYGLFKYLTVGISTATTLYTEGTNVFTKFDKGFSLDYIELFSRIKIIDYKNFIISLENTNKIPIFNLKESQGTNLFLPNPQIDIEIKLNAGYSLSANTYGIMGSQSFGSHFINLSFSYRKRFNIQYDEIKLELIYGVNFSGYFTVMLSFYKIVGFYQFPPETLSSLYNVGYIDLGKNDINRIGFSIVKNINKKSSVSLNFISDVYIDFLGSSKHNSNLVALYFGFWYNF